MTLNNFIKAFNGTLINIDHIVSIYMPEWFKPKPHFCFSVVAKLDDGHEELLIQIDDDDCFIIGGDAIMACWKYTEERLQNIMDYPNFYSELCNMVEHEFDDTGKLEK